MAYDVEKERQEALSAGRAALASLKRAQERLESAKSWGIYDLVGGGLISSLIKHNRMDEAQEYIAEARRNLGRFEDELRDLNNFRNINLDTRDFLGYADVIFDGLIADAIMQSRINDARAEISRAIQRVESILKKI